MTRRTGILLFDAPERNSCGWAFGEDGVIRFASVPKGRGTTWLTNLPEAACVGQDADMTLLPAEYLGFDFPDVLRVWGRKADDMPASYVVDLVAKQMQRVETVVARIASVEGGMDLQGPTLSHDVAKAIDPDVDRAVVPRSVARPSNRRMEEAVVGATVLRCPRLAYARMTVEMVADQPSRTRCIDPRLAMTALSSLNALSVTHAIVAQAIRRLFDVDPTLGDLDARFGRRLASEANEKGWMSIPGRDGAVLVTGVASDDPSGIFFGTLPRDLRPVISKVEDGRGRTERICGVDPIVADIGPVMAWEIDRRVCV